MPPAGLAAGQFPVYKRASSADYPVLQLKIFILPSRLESRGGLMNLPPIDSPHFDGRWAPGPDWVRSTLEERKESIDNFART